MCFFFFSSRRRHTRCALVTGVQTCALPILCRRALRRPTYGHAGNYSVLDNRTRIETAPVCARAQVPASHVAGFVSLSERHLHVNDELHGSVALDDQASRAITATGADHDLSERGAHREPLTSLHCPSPEELRVGKECVSTRSSRWSPYP